MKILILQDFLRSGGTERQSVLLANAFAAAGHATALVTFRPGGPLVATVNDNVSRYALQSTDTGLDWFAPGLLRVAQRLQPDIVLCMGRMANCRGGTLQRALPNAAVIATMRTGKPLPWLFRRSLRYARHVIANSREARDTLTAKYSVPPEKIAVIHNALVFPPVSALARDETLRAAHGAGPTTAVLLCVAMFRPEKNQRALIEIAARLPSSGDWQLWLAGDGPARADCVAFTTAKKLEPRVKFLGFQRDPSPFYRAADIAVHASWSESLSNFLIEAQAYGLPAVVYEAQGVGECFLPDKTGWVVPRDDPTAFLARLEPLLADPVQRRALAPVAQEYARAEFDAPRQVQAHLDLFARLLNRSASS